MHACKEDYSNLCARVCIVSYQFFLNVQIGWCSVTCGLILLTTLTTTWMPSRASLATLIGRGAPRPSSNFNSISSTDTSADAVVAAVVTAGVDASADAVVAAGTSRRSVLWPPMLSWKSELGLLEWSSAARGLPRDVGAEGVPRGSIPA